MKVKATIYKMVKINWKTLYGKGFVIRIHKECLKFNRKMTQTQ